MKLLGSAERSAVFLTRYGEPEPQNAAIKLVEANSQAAELISRWERASRLSHPHLVRLHRTGSWQEGQTGLSYVVMEYAEEELASVLRERPLTAAEASEMLGGVLDALAYIHGEGLAHGHLKPANILAVDDRLKISSDGIVGAGELASGAQKEGPYDPPEVLKQGFTPVGDIWSLGMTLVGALTQRLPTQRGPQMEPALPRGLTEPFLAIARRCLQADPEQRATIDEIAALLRAAPPQPAAPSAAGPPASSRKWWYIVPVAAIAAATLVGIGVFHKLEESEPAPPAREEQPAVPKEPERKAAKPEGSATAKTGAADRQASPGAVAAPAIPPKATFRPSGGAGGGEVVNQVLPDVPAKARSTIHGTVRINVRAHADASGRVVGAELEPPVPSPYIAKFTLEAVRQWQFSPVKVQGQDVPSQWLLRFEFTRSTTTVRPERVSPR